MSQTPEVVVCFLACVIPNTKLRFLVSPGNRCKQGVARTCLKLDMSRYWNAACDKFERYWIPFSIHSSCLYIPTGSLTEAFTETSAPETNQGERGRNERPAQAPRSGDTPAIPGRSYDSGAWPPTKGKVLVLPLNSCSTQGRKYQLSYK